MANRRQQNNNRRQDFGRNDRANNFGPRPGVSPWQGGMPTPGLSSLLPLGGGSTDATLALANNLISNLLQSRQNAVPSLLDMPIQRDFNPDHGNRFDHGQIGGGYGPGPNRMGNQGNFRRTGNYNRAGDRFNTNNRKNFRPNDGNRRNQSTQRNNADYKAKQTKESQSEKKEGEVKTELKEEAEDGKDKKETKEGKKDPKTRYDGIDPSLLRCHICNTSMWDGRSFENHINGMAHAIMMQKTAESYALTADTMRQEFKIRDMKRSRKSRPQTPRDFYCAMCDLYASDGPGHRTTVGHRKLKKFLHPSCVLCHKEMPTRIELDEHRLSPEHLRKRVPGKPDKDSKHELLTISTLSMEQSHVGRHQRKRGDEEKPADDAADGDKKVDAKNEKPPVPDTEETVLDYTEGDDLSNLTKEMFPAYNTERGVGRSFLGEFRCVQCKLCNMLLDSEETAEVHLKTIRHHQQFTRLLREKTAKPEEKQEEVKQEPSESGVPDGSKRSRPTSESEGTSSKRRKTSQEDGDVGDDDDDVELGEGHPETGGDVEMAEGDENWEEHEAGEDWDLAEEDEPAGEDTLNGDANGEAETPQEEIKADPEPEAPKAAAKAPETPKTPAKAPETPKTPAKAPEAPKTPAKAPEAPKTPAKAPEAPENPAAPQKSPAGTPGRGRGTPRGRARGRKRT